jgi:hypothetical protein
MEAVNSSETSMKFYRTIRRHIPEDGTFHNRRRENLNSVATCTHAAAIWVKIPKQEIATAVK